MQTYDTWAVVDLGCTSAEVRRSPDGARHVKVARDRSSRAELADERDRLAWLADVGVTAPEVLGWEDTELVSTLVTRTLPGIPASAVPASSAAPAVRALADWLAELHALPVAGCPFDQTLAVSLNQARDRVDRRRVDESDFDAERQGASARDLLHELEAGAPRATSLEPGSAVVCHGDACLPNVFVDLEGRRVTGTLDVGRLGVADRHADLALMARSMGAPGLNPVYGERAAQALLAAYPAPVDPWRLGFYRLLDEFS